ncbi:hypothetical protein CMV_010736 [Castanea mollissima]|uniref:Uncharacterized protein n=1 Tax=Castanea mollissima TaxID=60419 RepID=A0A8J4R6H9_9ROSI|nr:hypothetical protein CMV_010736 [Castanea mollissima]
MLRWSLKRSAKLKHMALSKLDVWILKSHAWTFRLSDAYKQEVSGLAERMAALMCVDIDLNSNAEETEEVVDGFSHQNGTKLSVFEAMESEIHGAKENGDGSVRWLELDELDIDDDTFLSLDLSTRFPGLLALSLCGNKLENVEIIAREVTKFEQLRALWLNNNPVVKNCDSQLENSVLQGLPRLEIYNSRFTAKFGAWALGFCGGVYGKDNPGSIHEGDHQLESAFSPVELPSLSYLNIQGNPLEQNSVAVLLEVLKEFPCLQSLEVDIPGPLGESAIDILESLPKLSELNGVNASKILDTGKHVIDSVLQPRLPEWTAEERVTDRIISAMWLYLMTYRLADEEKIDETSVWYVMDELGSALRHNDEPNFRVAPFLFMPEGNLASAVSFSILWPTQDVQKGDECTRDFLFGIGEDKQRSARLSAWFHTPQNFFIKEYEKHCQKLQSKSLISPSVQSSTTRSIHHTDGSPLRVYTDLPHVEEFLTRSQFVIISEPKDADIVWTSTQVDEDMKKAAGITDQQYINQFPFEACLVMKHHLAETVHKAYGSPEWLQPTYNLETHLSQLIGDYYVRKRDGLDNLWILKPWSVARTIDTTVTDNLSSIIRHMEAGPKICQKYIEHPALFNGKKFDLRYIGGLLLAYTSKNSSLIDAGFGGRTCDGTTSHCFNLNGSAGAFKVEGVEGIMAAYSSALHNVALAGPTLFGQVINKAAQIASQSISYNKYFVLLIITDGVLTDLQETKDALVRASDLPLSILIVGVGGADFTQMEVLDADDGRRLESSTGRVATHDIVQFVPMREVHSGHISVVQALLEELPGQFLTFIRGRDIKPRPLHVAPTSA